MRALRSLLAATLATGLAAIPLSSAPRAQEAPTPVPQHWSFDGLFGTYDLEAAQRGFKV